jgi:hypothetical protein
MREVLQRFLRRWVLYVAANQVERVIYPCRRLPRASQQCGHCFINIAGRTREHHEGCATAVSMYPNYKGEGVRASDPYTGD